MALELRLQLFPRSPACRPTVFIFGFARFHTCVSQFLETTPLHTRTHTYKHIHMCAHKHLVCGISLENTDIVSYCESLGEAPLDIPSSCYTAQGAWGAMWFLILSNNNHRMLCPAEFVLSFQWRCCFLFLSLGRNVDTSFNFQCWYLLAGQVASSTGLESHQPQLH